MTKKSCIKCQQEINPLRLKALPSTTTCVDCSSEAPKRGRVVTLGEGDHTYNELEILSEDTYRETMRLLYGERSLAPLVELVSLDEEEVQDNHNALKAVVHERLTQDPTEGAIEDDNEDYIDDPSHEEEEDDLMDDSDE